MIKYYDHCFFPALEATQTDNIVVGKSYETLQHQMWALLPGFCNKPTDLVQVSIYVITLYSCKIGEDIRIVFVIEHPKENML